MGFINSMFVDEMGWTGEKEILDNYYRIRELEG